MTSFEIAFMNNLIRSAYRRRMTYFIAHTIILIGMVSVLVLVSIGELELAKNYIFSITFIGFTLLGSFWMYKYLFTSSDDSTDFPWIIKNRQLKPLRDIADNKDKTFEDLKGNLELQEYFEL